MCLWNPSSSFKTKDYHSVSCLSVIWLWEVIYPSICIDHSGSLLQTNQIMADVPSTIWLHGQILPTWHPLCHQQPSKHSPMTYGYIIDWDDTKACGRALWNTPEALQALSWSIELSCIMHMRRQCQVHWPKTALWPVGFQDMIYLCITSDEQGCTCRCLDVYPHPYPWYTPILHTG